MKLPFVLIAATGLLGCSHNGPTFVYVFPNGFKGLALISEDKISGVELRQTNRTYIVEIPANGHLAVRNLDVFETWHRVEARYQDGNPIPLDNYRTNNQIGLYSLGFPSGLGDYYFVGTVSGYNTVRKSMEYTNMPLAKPMD